MSHNKVSNTVAKRRLEMYEKHRAWIRSVAIRSVFDKTNRLLGWDGGVRFVPPNTPGSPGSSYHPAWTDGKVVTINGQEQSIQKALEKGLDDKSLLWITGLNYHELAHCFFTPRLSSKIAQWAYNQNIFMAFNVLEDQAAESKFVALYPPARLYFLSTILNYMSGSTEISENYPLISGRKFLPLEIREEYRQNYSNPSVVDRIDKIVADYKRCVYPRDEHEMRDLITAMDKILQNHNNPTETNSHHNKEFTNGRPMSEEEQDDIVNRMQQQEEEQEEQEKPSQGASSVPGQEESDEAENGSESGGGAPGGSGASKRDEYTEMQPGEDGIEEMIDRALEEASDILSDELSSRRKSIKEAESSYRVERNVRDKPVLTDPSPEHVRISRQVEKEIRRLKEKYKQTWNRKQETGKIDTNQFANYKRGRTDVFKRYSPGVKGVTDIESVFLIDQSGSMFQRIRQASYTAWILHRALKNLESEVTVIGYSSSEQCNVLIPRKEPVSKMVSVYQSGGPTYLGPALDEATRIFHSSRAKMKLLFIITDGMFSDHSKVKDFLENADASVVIIGISHRVEDIWNPSVHRSLKFSRDIEDVEELTGLIKELTMELIREQYSRTRS